MCRRIEPYTEPESVPREFRARRRGAPRPTPRGGPYRHKRPRAGRGAYRGQEFDNSMSYRFALSRRLIVITDLPKHSAATSGVAKLSRSDEHTYELQSLMRRPYAVYCLKQKTLQKQ